MPNFLCLGVAGATWGLLRSLRSNAVRTSARLSTTSAQIPIPRPIKFVGDTRMARMLAALAKPYASSRIIFSAPEMTRLLQQRLASRTTIIGTTTRCGSEVPEPRYVKTTKGTSKLRMPVINRPIAGPWTRNRACSSASSPATGEGRVSAFLPGILLAAFAGSCPPPS